MRATYRVRVEVQGMDIGTELSTDHTLLCERADWDINDETSALQVQSQRTREECVWRSSQYDYFGPRAIGGSGGSSLSALISTATPYDECTCTDEPKYNSANGTIP